MIKLDLNFIYAVTQHGIMKRYENQVVQHCTKYFNHGKDNTTLVYDYDCTKRSILVKIPEEYGVFTQFLTEDKISIYEICENYPQIYEIYYKTLERVTFEHYRHKEREIRIGKNGICTRLFKSI
jgi:hypothetical protein